MGRAFLWRKTKVVHTGTGDDGENGEFADGFSTKMREKHGRTDEILGVKRHKHRTSSGKSADVLPSKCRCFALKVPMFVPKKSDVFNFRNGKRRKTGR